MFGGYSVLGCLVGTPFLGAWCVLCFGVLGGCSFFECLVGAPVLSVWWVLRF